NMTFRRMGAYNAAGLNNHCWLNWDSTDNLYEDIFSLGLCRNGFQEFGTLSARVTVRRGWFRWDGSHQDSGCMPFQLSYGSSDGPTGGNLTLENVITVWSGKLDETPHCVGTLSAGILFRNQPSAPYSILGSLVYGYSDAPVFPTSTGMVSANGLGHITIKDLVVIDPGYGVWPVFISCNVATLCPGNSITRASLVKTIQPSTIGSSWVQTNVSGVTSLSANDPFTGANQAALCYRYQNGVLQDG